MNGSRKNLIDNCLKIKKFDIAFEPYLSNTDLRRILLEDAIAHHYSFDIVPTVIQPLNTSAILATV
jgi:hypothetical protein